MTNCRTFLTLAVFAIFANACCSQEVEQRKRFKHELHGAVVFGKGDGYEIKCDIYQPFADKPRPIVLAIHGGAWAWGTKFSMLRHARILANRGYVVMSIDYRLAPKYKWPAQIHDCKHAVRWIREHADEYNADSKRVYAFGYSAGAHLATLLATTDPSDGLEGNPVGVYAKQSSSIQGLIAGGTPGEFSWVGDNDTTLKYWLGSTRADDPDVYAEASPITYISKRDPPMVFFHGIQDEIVPVSSPKLLLERCKESNVGVELLLSNGGHIAAFTWTTNFLDSLARLETMVSEKECRLKLRKISLVGKKFIDQYGRRPDSIAELERFAVDVAVVDAAGFKELMLNDRDGKQFEIQWSSDDEMIVSEAVGVNGTKLSSRD